MLFLKAIRLKENYVEVATILQLIISPYQKGYPMQVRNCITYALFFGSLALPAYATGKSTLFLPPRTTLADTAASLHAPVKFTNNGIQLFLKQTFNHPSYAQEILAHDFTHLLQFMDHGQKMNQKRTYCKSVLRLFSNKLKATPFVNAYAFSSMLDQLPQQLSNYFMIFKLGDLDPARLLVNEISMQYFASQVTMFKDNPKMFFDDLSMQIIDALNNRYQISEEITVEELRKSILLLLEIGLSKLVWTPDDNLDTWQLCKKIAEQLVVLIDTNIIADPDDLNDLFITLIERYCYFLDITSADLSADFFDKLKHIIASESCLLLEMDEQEQGIETKAERLMRAIMEGQARARARQEGMLT